MLKKRHWEPWEKNLYVIWAIQILSLAGFGFGLPFLPFYIQEMGVTDPDSIKQWTGWMASSTGLTMGLMAPVWGFLADRYGKKLMLLRATLSGTLIIGAMGLVNTPETLLTMRIIQGMFTGTVSAAVTLVASGTPREKSGYALGFLSSSTFIGFSLGPLAGGLAAEYLGYRYSFFIGGAILFVAMILTLFFVKELSDDPEPEKREGEERDKGC